MAFQLSPGVNVSEIDLTTIVPAVGPTEGAFAGNFAWGPVNEIVSVTDEIELVEIFGKPTANSFESFFTAANFLAYGNNLRVVRAGNTTTALNATANGANGISIPNKDTYELTYLDLSAANSFGMFAAKYPGELGNSLRVSLWASSNAAAYNAWTYSTQFNSAPGTSAYVAGVNGANDEMHIIVVDEDGKFTGTSNTVLEKFSYISKAVDARTDDGSSNYFVNVINDQSKYIYIINEALNSNGITNTSTWGLSAANTSFAQGLNEYTNSLNNGSYAVPTDATLVSAYDKFRNADEIDVALIMAGPHSQVVAEHIVDNIAEVRKDCVVFISPTRANVVNQDNSEVSNIRTFRNAFNSSSYAVMDSGWKYQFDKYNNLYRWIPLNGDIAGLCVRTDFERDPWFSPAGFNRGRIKNTVKLAWNPSKAERDDLYKIGVNPVVQFPGEGVVLYGDKTMLAKPSAFDRINVRRLFIVLEKAIARAAKYSLFEFNDEFTRAQFVALVEPFLRDVQGRRGIFDFRVVCNETNNTPEVIDRNEFIGDIYIKPARSINFIQLNFVAVRTGVAFEEVVGRF
jgi:hypothetical protein